MNMKWVLRKSILRVPRSEVKLASEDGKVGKARRAGNCGNLVERMHVSTIPALD